MESKRVRVRGAALQSGPGGGGGGLGVRACAVPFGGGFPWSFSVPKPLHMAGYNRRRVRAAARRRGNGGARADGVDSLTLARIETVQFGVHGGDRASRAVDDGCRYGSAQHATHRRLLGVSGLRLADELLAIDVSITSNAQDNHAGQALDTMARRKHGKYNAACKTAGWRFEPVIADCFAAFSPSARTMITKPGRQTTVAGIGLRAAGSRRRARDRPRAG